MTKYEKIMTMDINELAKFLKEFSDFEEDWQILRVWLDTDSEVLND